MAHHHQELEIPVELCGWLGLGRIELVAQGHHLRATKLHAWCESGKNGTLGREISVVEVASLAL